MAWFRTIFDDRSMPCYLTRNSFTAHPEQPVILFFQDGSTIYRREPSRRARYTIQPQTVIPVSIPIDSHHLLFFKAVLASRSTSCGQSRIGSIISTSRSVSPDTGLLFVESSEREKEEERDNFSFLR